MRFSTPIVDVSGCVTTHQMNKNRILVPKNNGITKFRYNSPVAKQVVYRFNFFYLFTIPFNPNRIIVINYLLWIFPKFWIRK